MRANPTLTVSLPRELLTSIRARAAKDRRPVSWTVADLIRSGLGSRSLRAVYRSHGNGSTARGAK